MEESKKLKLKAVISALASERDEAHAAILDILDNTNCEHPVLNLKLEFEKLSKAELNIETIQIFYANIENSEKIKKELQEKKENNDSTP